MADLQDIADRVEIEALRADGDLASGRTYLHELARTTDGREGLNYGVYHDRYRRTAAGWRFSERVYEVRYLDPTPPRGSAQHPLTERTSST